MIKPSETCWLTSLTSSASVSSHSIAALMPFCCRPETWSFISADIHTISHWDDMELKLTHLVEVTLRG